LYDFVPDRVSWGSADGLIVEGDEAVAEVGGGNELELGAG
jgi:hypothetical protein